VRDDPVVSILLPVRDAEGTLDSCLESLVDQTLPSWECIAIDDHSTDRSRTIMEAWAARDPRIVVFESPQPGGIIVALEAARRHARGGLLARQDADDRSLPTRLERQVEAMRDDKTLAIVGCHTQTPGDLSDGMRRYLDWIATCTDPATCGREIWIESPIAHPTAMMRASVIDEVGGYQDLGWPEDYDLWLRVHRMGGRIGNVSQVLYEWTDRPDRLSRRDPRYAPESFLRCRVHHLCRWLAERRITRPLVVWGAGRDGGRLTRAWEIEQVRFTAARAPEIVAFVDIDPRKIGRQRRGRPILDPESARGAFPDGFFLAAVGVPGARDLIRATLSGWGMLEEEDFLCLH
jgi:glycosyltransferase involved in cell wall biosynthesis